MFYMDQELKSASLIKEIIVLGYTSRIDTLPYQEPIGIEKVIDKRPTVLLIIPTQF